VASTFPMTQPVRKADLDPRALRAFVDLLFGSAACTIERTAEGTSTQVYRLRRGAEVFYLRAAEEHAASLAPEALVHDMLHTRGVRVPAVVHFEPFDQGLQRSLLVTTVIRGDSLLARPVDATTAAILRAAGRDLAAINGVSVEGFGWVRRDPGTATTLRAEHPTNRAFLLEQLDHDLDLLSEHAFSEREIDTIRGVIAGEDRRLDADQAYLAHGDLDLTHIYQSDGHYSGIIDFGEIRGAAPLYDLGHFRLHDGEHIPQSLLSHLLDGYGEVTPLPPDHDRALRFISLLIGIRALARSRRHGPSEYARYLTDRVRQASTDLAG
jgi:aminoglycoside phosphotransferase (APT) family kinase protein